MIINAPDSYGVTLVHAAVSGGEFSLERVGLLLQRGADMGVNDSHEDTPVQRAVRWGTVGCARALLDAGFDISTRGHRDRTILYNAATRNSTAVAKDLLKQGED